MRFSKNSKVSGDYGGSPDGLPSQGDHLRQSLGRFIMRQMRGLIPMFW
jgi:hypothetical protein